jgi:hypothetical protein
MPIRVHCPNGCLLRMPNDRAGKNVRCPHCKSIIAIPLVTESEKRSGKPIPIDAVLLAIQLFPKKESQTAEIDAASELSRSSPVLDGMEMASLDPGDSPSEINTDHPFSGIFDSREFEEEQNLRLVEELNSKIDACEASQIENPDDTEVNFATFLAAGSEKKGASSDPSYQEEIRKIGTSESHSKDPSRQLLPSNLSNGIEGDLERRSGAELGQSGGGAIPAQWLQRLKGANADRQVLARILGCVVAALAVIHALPGLFNGFNHPPIFEKPFVPRWVYLQFFVAGLHILYVILILQIPDWSTLRAVAAAMLAFAFTFGILCTALLFEAGEGTVTNFLALSQSTVQNATIWCALMLCLATAMALISGKEARDWRRAEQLMVEILANRA